MEKRKSEWGRGISRFLNRATPESPIPPFPNPIPEEIVAGTSGISVESQIPSILNPIPEEIVAVTSVETTTSKKEPSLVEVPMKVYSQASSSAGSHYQFGKETTPAPVEEILKCPYDSNHNVTAEGMSKHLERCRENYKHQVLLRGDMVNMMTCKYNYKHEVLPPEIFYHEQNCEDREPLPFYMLYINPWFEDEEELEYNLEHHDIDPTELQRMYEGLYRNEFIGDANLSLVPIPFEDIREPDAANEWRLEVEQNERTGNRAEYVKNMLREISWDTRGWLKKVFSNIEFEMDDSTEVSDITGDDSLDGRDLADDEDDEDEKYWNVPKEHPLDYMGFNRNPHKPIFKYPVGLTLSHRRLFDEWHARWVADILKRKPKDTESEGACIPSTSARARSVPSCSDSTRSAVVTDTDVSEMDLVDTEIFEVVCISDRLSDFTLADVPDTEVSEVVSVPDRSSDFAEDDVPDTDTDAEDISEEVYLSERSTDAGYETDEADWFFDPAYYPDEEDSWNDDEEVEKE